MVESLALGVPISINFLLLERLCVYIYIISKINYLYKYDVYNCIYPIHQVMELYTPYSH